MIKIYDLDMAIEKENLPLPTTYDGESPLVAKNRIKTMDYYKK